MSPRAYRQTRRATRASETRQRVLDATVALHAEQGIVATSMRDIAARADVAPATVLAHFPTRERLVEACGRRIDELDPPPTPAVLAGAGSLGDRLRRLLAALFTHYEPVLGPAHAMLQRDRRAVPQLDRYLRDWQRQHESLVREALRPIGSPPAAVKVVATLSDAWAWLAFHERGIGTAEAAGFVASVLEAWLETRPRAGRERRARAGTARPKRGRAQRRKRT